jgi:hypothetical protein
MFSSETRVCSATIEAILIALPSTVESNRKSLAYTTFGASGSTGGIDDTPACLRGEITFHLQSFFAPQSMDLLLIYERVHRG